MRFSPLLLLSVLLLPSVAFATAARSFSELVSDFVVYLDWGAITLVSLAIVIYFAGVAKNLIKINNGEAKSNLSEYLVWGLVGIFVMVSLWGLVRLVQNTIFGTSNATYYSTN